MDRASTFNVLIDKHQSSKSRYMQFDNSDQCARYFLSTGKLSPQYFLAGQDLIFDAFRIRCHNESQASGLSKLLSF